MEVHTLFPTHLPEWPWTWDASTGTLSIFASTASEAARTIELRAASAVDGGFELTLAE